MAPKKQKRGRPKKPTDQLQVESIYVRVTAAEKADCEQAAGQVGLGQWARDILTRAARRALRDK